MRELVETQQRNPPFEPGVTRNRMTSTERSTSALGADNPTDNSDIARPRLCITVDTEEEGLWSGRYRMTGNTVENIQGVPRFQAVCDQLGIRPTYLVDAPVVADDRASDILAEIHSSGRCEIGAHIHPWCNPPLDEVHDRRESYLCNLPADLQRAKLQWLTETITERFGAPPVSFRAGRYGLDIVGARILAQLGYRVDSSVIPFTDYSPERGPDFSTAPWQPYPIGEDNLCEPGSGGDLLEVPVSVGYNWRDFARAASCVEFLRRRPFRWMRVEGVLDEVRLLRRIKLSPEGQSARDLCTLVDRYCDSPGRSLVLMFHSTSLSPGQSPYVQTEEQLSDFLTRIVTTCERCFDYHGASPVTLGEMATT